MAAFSSNFHPAANELSKHGRFGVTLKEDLLRILKWPSFAAFSKKAAGKARRQRRPRPWWTPRDVGALAGDSSTAHQRTWAPDSDWAWKTYRHVRIGLICSVLLKSMVFLFYPALFLSLCFVSSFVSFFLSFYILLYYYMLDFVGDFSIIVSV